MAKAKKEEDGQSVAGGEMIPAAVPVPVASWTAIRSLSEAMQLAELIVKSAALPDVRNTGQAVLKILAGAEMGFGAFASLVDVHIIEGKPAVGAHLKAAAIKRSGIYDYAVKQLDRDACEIEFSRRGQLLGTVRYTMEEANRSGVCLGAGGKIKANWARHPDDMLFARCISKGYRRYCPDLSGGVLAYDPDELEPYAGPVVDAEFTVQAPPAEVLAVQRGPAREVLTTGQVTDLRDLMAALGVAVEKIDAALNAAARRDFERDTFQVLGPNEADDMIGRMKARVAQREAGKQAQQAPDANGAASPG